MGDGNPGSGHNAQKCRETRDAPRVEGFAPVLFFCFLFLTFLLKTSGKMGGFGYTELVISIPFEPIFHFLASLGRMDAPGKNGGELIMRENRFARLYRYPSED